MFSKWPSTARLWLFTGLATIQVTLAAAQDARFFRIVGPVPTTVTKISADGWVTWTNIPTNATFNVQTAVSADPLGDWTDYLQVPVTNAATVHRLFDLHPPKGMAFIPAGAFTMGDNLEGGYFSDSTPLHTVYVSAIYMDVFEVPGEVWGETYTWATNHGYSLAPGGFKAPGHPIQSVNWYDAVKWCNARSEQENLTPCYYTDGTQTTVYRTGDLDLTNVCVNWNANGYRLPTEAEWEKGSRGGLVGQRFSWGNTITHSQANYYSHTNYYGYPMDYDISPTRGSHPVWGAATSPVGSFAPNGYGLHDMAGNLGEWVWDYSAPYTSAPQSDPHGPETANSHYRILRGSAWIGTAVSARCGSHPDVNAPGIRVNCIGFRSVRKL